MGRVRGSPPILPRKWLGFPGPLCRWARDCLRPGSWNWHLLGRLWLGDGITGGLTGTDHDVIHDHEQIPLPQSDFHAPQRPSLVAIRPVAIPSDFPMADYPMGEAPHDGFSHGGGIPGGGYSRRRQPLQRVQRLQPWRRHGMRIPLEGMQGIGGGFHGGGGGSCWRRLVTDEHDACTEGCDACVAPAKRRRT